jgi:hypothetical protein
MLLSTWARWRRSETRQERRVSFGGFLDEGTAGNSRKYTGNIGVPGVVIKKSRATEETLGSGPGKYGSNSGGNPGTAEVNLTAAELLWNQNFMDAPRLTRVLIVHYNLGEVRDARRAVLALLWTGATRERMSTAIRFRFMCLAGERVGCPPFTPLQ